MFVAGHAWTENPYGMFVADSEGRAVVLQGEGASV